MISKKVTTSNPMIYNITLKISSELSEEWLEAMKNDFLPKSTDGQVIVASQLNEILIESEDGDYSYAVQFIFASRGIFEREGLPALAKFLELLDSRFLGKYVYFTTKMEVLHQQAVPSEN